MAFVAKTDERISIFSCHDGGTKSPLLLEDDEDVNDMDEVTDEATVIDADAAADADDDDDDA